MTAGTLVWLVLGAICAVLFFAIAAVVSAYGVKDLRRLLRGAEEQKRKAG